MLITEWNLEEAQQAWLAQGRDEGRSEGRNEGIEIGVGRGRNEGIEIGMGRGRNEGKEQARKEILSFIAKGYTLEDIQRELSATVRK